MSIGSKERTRDQANEGSSKLVVEEETEEKKKIGDGGRVDKWVQRGKWQGGKGGVEKIFGNGESD